MFKAQVQKRTLVKQKQLPGVNSVLYTVRVHPQIAIQLISKVSSSFLKLYQQSVFERFHPMVRCPCGEITRHSGTSSFYPTPNLSPLQLLICLSACLVIPATLPHFSSFSLTLTHTTHSVPPVLILPPRPHTSLFSTRPHPSSLSPLSVTIPHSLPQPHTSSSSPSASTQPQKFGLSFACCP